MSHSTQPTITQGVPTVSNQSINNPAFFSSSLDTLAESLEADFYDHLSLHDLQEAYNLLSVRIKSQIHILSSQEHDKLLPAIELVKSYSNVLLQALRRDVKRALVHPLASRKDSSSRWQDSPVSDVHIMTNEDAKHARDLISLCHQALRFLSTVFRFPRLYSIFSLDEIIALLDDILAIARAPTLPTPNSRKTYALVFWTLQAQRLPPGVIASRKTQIISVVQLALSGKLGCGDQSEVTQDALKITQAHIIQHAFVSHELFSDLVSTILPLLVSPDLDLRFRVAHALGGFALAASTSPHPPSMSPQSSISHVIHSFIDDQMSQRPSSTDFSDGLPTIIRHCLSLSSHSHAGESPFWALTVLASLTILVCSPSFTSSSSPFDNPRMLKLLLLSAGLLAAHPSRTVRSLHPLLWKCLVWAYGCKLGCDNDIEERAFLVVKQDLRADIGASLVTCLLDAPRFANLRTAGTLQKVIAVIHDMVRTENEQRNQDGLAMLVHLVSAIGTPRNQEQSPDSGGRNSSSTLFTNLKPLFDGTVLNLRLDDSRLNVVVEDMPRLRPENVRPLSEEEIADNWESLVAVWVECVGRALMRDRRDSCIEFRIQDDLLRVWQCLLLVQAQLTQGYAHLTTPFTAKAISIVSSFLSSSGTQIDQTQRWGNGEGLESLTETESQYRRLVLAQQLWSVICNVFVHSWLQSPAQDLLVSVFRCNFALQEERIRRVWSGLCAKLVVATGAETGIELIACVEGEGEKEVRRLLWAIVAKKWIEDTSDGCVWMDSAKFLLLPFGAWTLHDSDVKLWERVLRRSISSAQSAGITSLTVIVDLIKAAEGRLSSYLPSMPRIAFSVFSLADLSGETDASDLAVLLSTIDGILCALYPPLPEHLLISLDILRVVGVLITTAPLALTENIITALQRGLRLWIEDEREVLLEEEYNRIIMPVYSNSLEIVKQLPLTISSLRALAPFLASAFVRIPPPALGPMAFEQFWRATYHRPGNHRQQQHAYPETIKLCLKAFDDAFGGSLAADISLDTDSQMTDRTSQPEPHTSIPLRHLSNGESFHKWLDNESANREKEQTSVSLALKSPSTKAEAVLLYALPEASAVAQGRNVHSPPSIEATSIVLHQLSEHSVSMSHFRDPNIGRAQDDDDQSHALKRSSNKLVRNRFAKRRKTDPETTMALAAREESGRGDIAATDAEYSMSRPTTTVTSPAPRRRQTSDSVFSNNRTNVLIFDGVEVPTLSEVLKTKKSDNPMMLSFNSHFAPSSAPNRPSDLAWREARQDEPSSPASSVDDFDSWEAALPSPEMRRIQRELTESEINDCPETQSFLETQNYEEGIALLSASARLRGGSEPAWTASKDAEEYPQPLTGPTGEQVPKIVIPLQRAQTTSSSSRLHMLQEAYTLVAQGASQMQVQDLLRANRLVHKMGTVLNEQMNKKLDREAGSIDDIGSRSR